MRSFLPKTHLLEAFLEEKPNVGAVCITESWLTSDKLKYVNINGYSLVSSYSRINQEGGGVCILLKNSIEFKNRSDINSLSIESVFEICATEIVALKILLITLYWPNTNKKITSRKQNIIIYNQLEKLMEILDKKDRAKSIVLGGDLNINFNKNTKKKRKLSNFMLTYNFRQQVKVATRVTKSTATCLDLIFVKSNNQTTQEPSVHELGFSDHRGILLPIVSKILNFKYFLIDKRTYSEQNMTKFQNELMSVKWQDIIKPDKNINENYDDFEKILKQTLDKCIPIKRIKIPLKPKVTWLTKGIKRSCMNKRLDKIHLSQTNSKILNNHHKLYEKILKKVVHKARKLKNITKIKNSNNKMKTMWQIINKETNKNIQMKQNITLETINSCLTNPKTVANSFNNFFATIGAPDKTLQKLNHNQNSKLTKKVTEPIENSIYLPPVEPREVGKVIKYLKNKYSYGIDEIPPILIKKCSDSLTLPYTELINQSLNEGIFPDSLKISIVKPIHKNGELTDTNNYRPIALLPTSSKIFESIMCKRMYSFYEKYNVFDNNQYGFRKGRSTIFAVYKYVNKILDTLNARKYAVGLLLDMSKAYDRVDYEILLSKLYNTGIRGIAYKWLRSYLTNREQYVEVENINFTTGLLQNVRSDRISMSNSIPQGSVLGCILFLVYINDLPKIIDDHCILFADDISILFPCMTMNELKNRLDITFDKIIHWLNEHNLKLNFKKTTLIQFRPYQKTPLQLHYDYENCALNVETAATLLGIRLDTSLCWKAHVEKLTKNLSSFAYALLNLKKVTNFHTAVSTYYSYVQSRLAYGIVLWGNCTNMNHLMVLQKKCIRILVNIERAVSCKPYFIKHKILTVTSVYILECCKFILKHFELYSPITVVKRNNRGLNKLRLPFSTLSLYRSGSHSMAIQIFNAVPNCIKSQPNIKMFEKHLKKYLLENAFYTLQDFFSDNNTQILN